MKDCECLDGYFLTKNGTCEPCSSKCKACSSIADNCEVCSTNRTGKTCECDTTQGLYVDSD